MAANGDRSFRRGHRFAAPVPHVPRRPSRSIEVEAFILTASPLSEPVPDTTCRCP